MFTLSEFQAARKSATVKPLDCPHCGERLTRHGRLVIATRHCPSCGRRVIAEPEGDETPPFSREQFDAACATYSRSHSRATWFFLAGFLLFFVSVVLLGLFRDTFREAMRTVADPGMVFILAAFGPCGVIFLVALVRLDRLTRTALKCPHCAAPCSVAVPGASVNLTHLTGNCASCGRKLLNELELEDPGGPLPAVDEFKAADRRLHRGDWILLTPLAALALMMAAPSFFDKPDRLWQHFEERYGILNGTLLAVGLICGWALVAGGIAFACLSWVSRRQRRRREASPVLNCPHCKEPLVNALHVVASQRCPSCRRRVLADPDAASVGVAEPPSGG